MRRVLETDFGINIHDLFAALFHQGVSYFESFTDKPFFGSEVADFLEIPFECGKAASRVVCHLFHRELVHVVLVHKFQNIYFLKSSMQMAGKVVLNL